MFLYKGAKDILREKNQAIRLGKTDSQYRICIVTCGSAVHVTYTMLQSVAMRCGLKTGGVKSTQEDTKC